MKQKSFRLDWPTITLFIVLIFVIYLYKKAESAWNKNMVKIGSLKIKY
jgi:hypothetical protein